MSFFEQSRVGLCCTDEVDGTGWAVLGHTQEGVEGERGADVAVENKDVALQETRAGTEQRGADTSNPWGLSNREPLWPAAQTVLKENKSRDLRPRGRIQYEHVQ